MSIRPGSPPSTTPPSFSSDKSDNAEAPSQAGRRFLCAYCYSTISSIFGALVITSAPVERRIITSSMRTPNLPGR